MLCSVNDTHLQPTPNMARMACLFDTTYFEHRGVETPAVSARPTALRDDTGEAPSVDRYDCLWR